MTIRRLVGLLPVLIATTLVPIACSSPTGGDSGACSQGQTRSCDCSSGGTGSQVCSADGFWKTCSCSSCAVTPSCKGKACGEDDGCGNACRIGTCPDSQACVDGACQAPCTTTQVAKNCSGKRCGELDGCGGVCQTGPCAASGYSCVAGECVCTPVCKTCGASDGCGGTCKTGSCSSAGQMCVAGSCEIDPASRWMVTVTSGTVVNNGWDALSAPDAIVCVWVGGTRHCTQDISDTMAPTWNCALGPFTAASLMTGVEVAIFDNDLSSSGTCGWKLTADPGEPMCTRGSVPIKAGNFTSGTWGAGCAQADFKATLTVAP